MNKFTILVTKTDRLLLTREAYWSAQLPCLQSHGMNIYITYIIYYGPSYTIPDYSRTALLFTPVRRSGYTRSWQSNTCHRGKITPLRKWYRNQSNTFLWPCNWLNPIHSGHISAKISGKIKHCCDNGFGWAIRYET